MVQISLVLNDLRGAYNVGSIFRSADAFGVAVIYLVGTTPYPELPNDTRLEHIRRNTTKKIAKTALGAENSVPCEHRPAIMPLLAELRSRNENIYALEQHTKASPLDRFQPQSPCTLIVGNEVTGLPIQVIEAADACIEIPMQGQKESLNAAVATAVALHAFRVGLFRRS